MKDGWKVLSLRNCCDILDSKRVPITKSKREKGDVPYYGATGLQDYVKDYLFDEPLVLLGEDGAKWGAGENSAYKIDGKSWVNNHAHVLRPRRDLLKDEWLIYFLNYSDLQGYITGVTVPKLNQEKMGTISIPVPPLSDQQSIVEYLDSSFAKIDAMKANAKKALNEGHKFLQESINFFLVPQENWIKKKLQELGESKVGPFGSLLHKSDYVLNGVPLINPMHISNGCINEDYSFSVNKDKYNELQSYIMQEGDIVIGRRGEMGRCAVVRREHSGFLCGTGSIFFRPNTKLVYPDFLQMLLSSKKIVALITEVAGGATMLNLSSKGLNSITVDIPSLSEQQLIVSTVDSLKSKVDQLQSNYNQISKECDALKQALLKQVFE